MDSTAAQTQIAAYGQCDFQLHNTPSFVDDDLNRTRSYAPELNLSLHVNVSRLFRFSVGTRTAYIYSKNNVGQNDKYFQQGASVNTELTNIFKRFYLMRSIHFLITNVSAVAAMT